MIKGGLKLFTYCSKDEDAIENNEKFDIEIPEDSIELKPVTFYIIDNVQEAVDSVDTCVIQSGGCYFVVNESSESVNQKIKERQNFLYN